MDAALLDRVDGRLNDRCGMVGSGPRINTPPSAKEGHMRLMRTWGRTSLSPMCLLKSHLLHNVYVAPKPASLA